MSQMRFRIALLVCCCPLVLLMVRPLWAAAAGNIALVHSARVLIAGVADDSDIPGLSDAVPASPGLLRAAGLLELKRGEAARAAHIFEGASVRYPSDPLVRSFLAHALYELGDRSRAAALWARAGDRQALAHAVEDCLARQEWDMAILFAEYLAAAYPEDLALAKRNMARAMFWGKGDLHQSLDQLDAALQYAPKDVDTVLLYGEILREAGHLEEASYRFQQASDLAPGDPDPLVGLGSVAARAGNTDSALAYLTAAEVLCSECSQVSFWRGWAYAAAGRAVEAEAAFVHAVALNPEFTWGWVRLGQFYESMGEDRKAVGAYRRALELAPNDTWVAERVATLQRLP